MSVEQRFPDQKIVRLPREVGIGLEHDSLIHGICSIGINKDKSIILIYVGYSGDHSTFHEPFDYIPIPKTIKNVTLNFRSGLFSDTCNADVVCRDFNEVVNALERYCKVKLNVILDDTVILDDEDTFVV